MANVFIEMSTSIPAIKNNGLKRLCGAKKSVKLVLAVKQGALTLTDVLFLA